MATPDFPQERRVHDAFGYVGFLLAEVRVFTFFEGGNRKHKRSVIFFYTLKNRGHFLKLYFPFGGESNNINIRVMAKFQGFPLV